MTFVLALSSTAHAAVYLWNGSASAADGLWEAAINWIVTDSLWTWPNEEYGNRQVNSDTIAIDILNGDAVSRGSDLGIDGAADGSTTGVLTLDNGSSLTVAGALVTSTDPGRRGQIDVLGGSFVTIVGDGNDIRIADDPDTWGMLNIVDSTVDIADDLRLDEGEGYVNISGSSTLNADDFLIADANTSVGFLDISGSVVVTLIDDFTIDEGIGIVTIGGDAVINFGDDCYLPDQPGAVGTMTLTGNSVFNVGDDMTIADDANTVGHVIVTGNATLNAPDELYLADANTAFGILDVNGTATVIVGDDLNIGEDGPGICNIGENATVTIADDIYIAHNVAEGAFESHMTISGNASLTCGDLIVANNGGLTGYLHISGNPTIHTTTSFYMNDDEGDPSYSQIIMDGGTVTVDGYTTFNDDNPGTAEFIMNGGSFYSAGYLNLSDNLDGTAHLTMNGGEMITGDALRLGKDGGEDTGQVRIFMNGGLLQAEELSDIKITDTQIIYAGTPRYAGGVFRIGAASLDVAGMQQMVADGTIVIPDGLVYSIVSNGIYTEINTVLPLIPQMPYPADGAEGVLLGSSLIWAPGATAATNDVYFGTTNPPAFAASVEAVPYYPGPLEPGTTYYWQVDAVEADGTTKHSSEVWSFTATTETSNAMLDIRIATGNDDVEERLREDRNGDLDMGSSDLEFPYEDFPIDDAQRIGLRFVDVGIPQGSQIVSSYIEFEVDEIKDDSNSVNVIIDGQLTPDAEPFVDEFMNVSQRPAWTSTVVPWSVPNWIAENDKSQTPDISVLVQELVDQADWAGGNAMVFTIQDDPANPSEGVRAAESYDGESSNAPLLHIEGVVKVATQPSPADGAEGVPLDATLGWWPGISAVSHDVYLDTIATTSFAMPTYLVDGDSNSLPWDVAHGTITFDGQINTYGNDPDFLSAGASGNTLDIPDGRNWAELSFDFDVDFVEFIYGGNVGNITVEARDKDGAVIASFYQADTYGGKPAGPVTLSGPGIRSLHWKDTSILPWKGPSSTKFAALDNILLTILPPELLGNTTQVSFDPGVLAPSTTYYWQVDTVEADGTTHTGAVRSFTTELGKATQPDPADNALVALDKILSWKPGVTAATHDVYFGTTSPPPFIGNQAESSFAGPLESDTTYYWQVDEIEADGTTIYTGDIWSFTTVLDIPITDPNLVGWWKLDDEGLGIAVDYSGYNHYGTFNGDPQFTAGYDGDALDFDGDDYVVLGTAGDLNFGDATDFSVALWVNTTGWQDDAAIISNKDWNSGGNTGWVIAGQGGGSGSWQWNWNVSGGSRADYDPPGPTLSDGEWNYICVTHDRDGMAKFYFDGVFQDERDISASTGTIDSGYPTVIGTDGAEGAVWAYWFIGLIDDVRIYNKVLTEAEIQMLAAPPEAWSPDPADGATEVSKTATLSWLAGATAASHDVYFGADSAAVSDGTAFIANQAETSYSPAGLEKGITYYWRVDEVEADGTTKHTGAVWSFTVTTLGR